MFKPVQSSMIQGISYKKGGEMLVQFRNKTVYKYTGVPPGLHRQLMQAQSKGKFFLREIRDRYNDERVE